MPSTPITGRSGSVLVGAYTMCITKWVVTNSAEDIDVTDSCDGNSRKFIAQPVMTKGTASGYYDTGSVPYPSCKAGVTATIVLSIGNSGKSFSIPALITKDQVTNTVLGVNEFEIEFSQTGAVVYPS